tara:strand:+ start:601 stop:849 length:249 start_codon:yes stop_codon:yes gene_type:complete
MHDWMIALWVLGYVVTPIAVETNKCLCPKKDVKGVVCDWKSKAWKKKFDLKTKTYYYTLEDVDKSDNFVEKKMRERFLDKKK